MKISKLIIAALLASSASYAAIPTTARWVDIGVTTANGGIVYGDANSVVRSGNRVTFWVSVPENSVRLVSHDTLNCDTFQYIIIESHKFDSAGNDIDSSSYPLGKVWQDVARNTVGWAIAQKACASSGENSSDTDVGKEKGNDPDIGKGTEKAPESSKPPSSGSDSLDSPPANLPLVDPKTKIHI